MCGGGGGGVRPIPAVLPPMTNVKMKLRAKCRSAAKETQLQHVVRGQWSSGSQFANGQEQILGGQRSRSYF